VLLRKIKGFSCISQFEPLAGSFYGEEKPDFGFAWIDLQGLTALEICGDSNVIEVGLDVATVGFPMGHVPLTPYRTEKASQICAFARRGTISSVLPCACADPHGFSVDILSEGGASGSPIFRVYDPRPIGILHAGYNGAPITYGVPGHLLREGLKVVLNDWRPDLDGVPTLKEIVEEHRLQAPKPFEWAVLNKPT